MFLALNPSINPLCQNSDRKKSRKAGFFIFKKEIYKKNKKKLYANGYKILADLIYNSEKSLKILDQDIFFDTRKSGKSKMNIIILVKLLIFITISFGKKLIWINV